MIIGKQRQVPRKLLFCQAARARLATNHPLIPIIDEDIRRCEAGHAGEERLDRLLMAKYHEQNYHLIQGLQLPFGASTDSLFQIDTLLLKPTHIIPIENKNMTGELIINRQIGQMIQTVGDKRNVYEDPLTQVQLQAQHLYQWMIGHGFPSVCIEPLVMMSNSNCILRIDNDAEAQYRICRGRKVLFRMDDFDYKHRTNLLTPDQLHEMSRLMVQENIELWYDFEKIYKTPRSHLRPGVHCSNCRYLGMNYHQGWWFCPRCRCKSSDAHLAALRDYYLLWGPEITNAMYRWFLGIDSIHVASKLLKKLNLPFRGQNKYRVYILSFEIF